MPYELLNWQVRYLDIWGGSVNDWTLVMKIPRPPVHGDSETRTHTESHIQAIDIGLWPVHVFLCHHVL